MKNLKVLMMVLAMGLVLCACGKSEAATECEEMIDAIGEVTLDSEADIVEAEDAYWALSDEEQESIEDSFAALEEAREVLDELIAEQKLEEIKGVIDSVGEVTLESEAAIVAAEEAYASLSTRDQGKLAEEAAKIAELRAAYDALMLEQEANAVVAAIEAMGPVTLESGAAIEEIKAMYNGLSAEVQALVGNYAVIESAEAQLAELKAAEKQRILSEYTSKFEIDEDRVTGITWYYHNDMPDYIDIRSYIIPYIGVQGNNAWICIRYNYTEDDWIFWENLTIVTDNDNYYVSVDYFDTTRDNDGGVVWEFYDEPLNYNQAMDSYQLQMLQDVANSADPLIRFEGDEYYWDLDVSGTDQAIIRDVLALYSALIS